MDPPITSDPYIPTDELQDLLTEVFEETRIDYDEQRELDLGGTPAVRRSYTARLDEFELNGTETFATIGTIYSLTGNLGFASAFVLANAIAFGEPTHAYLDQGPPPEPYADYYEDLTAEWYPPSAVELGLPKNRLERRVPGLEAELIATEELEEWARVWLSSGV